MAIAHYILYILAQEKEKNNPWNNVYAKRKCYPRKLKELLSHVNLAL